MRPKDLKPGNKVVWNERVFEFVRRDPPRAGRGAKYWFRCEDFRGALGPGDDGIVWMSDRRVARECRAA